MGVYVSRIDAATGVARLPVHASPSGSLFDKPWVGVHNDGSVAVAFTRRSEGLFVMRSSDQGTTFAQSLYISGAFFFRPRFCIDRSAGPTAPWYLVYAADGAIQALRSMDAGATWPTLIFDKTGAADQDPGCVARGNDLWISVAGGFTFGNEIVMFHSGDGGSTFEPGVRVAKNELLLNPALAMTASGTLMVSYTAESNGRALFKLARSADGKSFACSTLADVGSFPNDYRWYGANSGLAASGGHVLAVFGDDLFPNQTSTQIGWMRLDAP
jgi:hypothetical protein